MKNNTFEKEYKDAIDLINQYVPEEKDRRKPIIPHLLRVGKYLYENNYSDDIVNAGLLHDMIEWTESPKEIILNKFGQHVYDIVIANTKNRDIKDPDKRRNDYIDKCVQVGKDALIVKSADVLDSYNYYKTVNNQEEIDRSVAIAKLILEKLPKDITDPIFKKLNKII